MPKPQIQGRLAIDHADGTVSVMTLYADVDADAEVKRSAFSSPAVRWRVITAAEADAIRAARPKPTLPPIVDIPSGAPSDTDERIRLLAQHVLDLTTRHDEMATAYAALKERTEYIEEKALAQVDLMEGK